MWSFKTLFDWECFGFYEIFLRRTVIILVEVDAVGAMDLQDVEPVDVEYAFVPLIMPVLIDVIGQITATHIACNHSSSDCTTKAPGHQDRVTLDNRMGKSNAVCQPVAE